MYIKNPRSSEGLTENRRTGPRGGPPREVRSGPEGAVQTKTAQLGQDASRPGRCRSAQDSAVLSKTKTENRKPPTAYPFTAPAVKPSTMLRWKNSTRIMSGTVTTTLAAMIPAHGSSY